MMPRFYRRPRTSAEARRLGSAPGCAQIKEIPDGIPIELDGADSAPDFSLIRSGRADYPPVEAS
jgi:hypothetical protein